jgi:hypothetical protein
MKEKYYPNWNSAFLFLVGAAILLIFGYEKYGLSRGVLIGGLGEIACTLWLVWERWTTYVAIEDNRWMINGEQRLFPDIKVDIASILYIARVPHFIFRLWGGRMVIFFREATGKVRQTGVPETLYSWNNLQAILKKLMSIKPSIELDPQYQLLISKKDPLDADLSQQLPRSVKEVESYVASKYGPP